MRLDKFLADSTVATRSQVKLFLKQKRVEVNGQVVTNGKVQVNEKLDQIFLDGEAIQYESFIYYLMNKPKGVISATEDTKHATVIDLLDEYAQKRGVFPVGRLDIDTHGLLLLTDNGALAHAMLSPKKHVAKRYIAEVDGVMDDADQEQFRTGMTLEDGYQCLPAQLEILMSDEEAGTSRVAITVDEGKFHQVKRMVQVCGKKVVDLQRVSMGPLQLDSGLQLGEYRALTAAEMHSLTGFQVEL